MKAMSKFCFPAFVAVFLLGTSARGMADEDICVHGQSAQSQTPHAAPTYYGWGITLAQPSPMMETGLTIQSQPILGKA
jgi:hypothetical protein